MNSSCNICVIGAGAVGKASALALAQAGHEVVLLSPDAPASGALAAPEHWDQRVYALNHTTHALLSSLKVWDAMDAARIAPVDAMAIHGDDAGLGGHVGFDAFGARVGALAWIVEDSNLNQALDSALRFAPGVKRIASSASRLQIDGEKAEVILDNGNTLTCSLVVGADGANSWVRGQADINIDYRSYNQTAVVANFECEQPHHGAASQWFLGPDGIVALLPLPGNRVSLVWSAPEPLANKLLAEPPQVLCDRLEQLPGMSLGRLTMLPPAKPRAIPLRLIRTYTPIANRIALVGDAAHVVHPMAGHGMNLGFGDIDALVAALSQRDNAADCGDARTLGRYARLRKEEVLLMQLATDGLHRLFSTDIAPVRHLRNAGMGLLDKLPFLKRRLMSHAFGRAASLPTGD
jgi:ubiquinone biosynthesis UbiH/UbiF/VisC/COQ6 family hydroxylase